MPHYAGYRTIATRHDGFRSVIAEGLSKETAEGVAQGMRDMGYDHQFSVECATCADGTGDSLSDSDAP